MVARPETDVLDAVPSAESIRNRLKANREEADALKKLLKIAVSRDTARELRSRSVPALAR